MDLDRCHPGTLRYSVGWGMALFLLAPLSVRDLALSQEAAEVIVALAWLLALLPLLECYLGLRFSLSPRRLLAPPRWPLLRGRGGTARDCQGRFAPLGHPDVSSVFG